MYLKTDVRSLLGMANCSSKYIANFATITSPPRELTKTKEKLEWTEQHQKVFNCLTQALSSAPYMAYFDKQKKLVTSEFQQYCHKRQKKRMKRKFWHMLVETSLTLKRDIAKQKKKHSPLSGEENTFICTCMVMYITNITNL